MEETGIEMREHNAYVFSLKQLRDRLLTIHKENFYVDREYNKQKTQSEEKTRLEKRMQDYNLSWEKTTDEIIALEDKSLKEGLLFPGFNLELHKKNISDLSTSVADKRKSLVLVLEYLYRKHIIVGLDDNEKTYQTEIRNIRFPNSSELSGNVYKRFIEWLDNNIGYGHLIMYGLEPAPHSIKQKGNGKRNKKTKKAKKRRTKTKTRYLIL
jgi:hypothetical protein